jgi:hypothetical protein
MLNKRSSARPPSSALDGDVCSRRRLPDGNVEEDEKVEDGGDDDDEVVVVVADVVVVVVVGNCDDGGSDFASSCDTMTVS